MFTLSVSLIYYIGVKGGLGVYTRKAMSSNSLLENYISISILLFSILLAIVVSYNYYSFYIFESCDQGNNLILNATSSSAGGSGAGQATPPASSSPSAGGGQGAGGNTLFDIVRYWPSGVTQS